LVPTKIEQAHEVGLILEFSRPVQYRYHWQSFIISSDVASQKEKNAVHNVTLPIPDWSIRAASSPSHKPHDEYSSILQKLTSFTRAITAVGREL